MDTTECMKRMAYFVIFIVSQNHSNKKQIMNNQKMTFQITLLYSNIPLCAILSTVYTSTFSLTLLSNTALLSASASFAGI